MKRIKYWLCTVSGGRGAPKTVDCADDRLESALTFARAEAYNGEYEIIDDGKPEPAPTQLDRIEAQAAYTAMMTDTLLEG